MLSSLIIITATVILMVAGQVRPLSQVGPGSTRPESTRPGVFSDMYMIYSLGFAPLKRLNCTRNWRLLNSLLTQYVSKEEKQYESSSDGSGSKLLVEKAFKSYFFMKKNRQHILAMAL